MYDTEFMIFVDSQLHGADWPKEACAVVAKDVFGTQKPFVVRNHFHGTHSEEELIHELEQYLEENRARDVQPTKRHVQLKLFLNYSPCFECSSRLIGFIDDCKSTFDLEISLEFVFSGIYNIKRPSCIRCECNTYHYKLNHVKANIEGLELIRDGATLRTFEEKDWRELASILELPEERAEEAIRRRGKEDSRMRQDLQEMLAGPSFGR